MTFQFDNELKEISNVAQAVRAERLASAFRRVCKEITWNTRAKLHDNLHATPTAMVSPITIETDDRYSYPVFTLTAVKSGETLKVSFGDAGVTFATPVAIKGIYAKRNGDLSGLAGKMEKAVTNWLKEKAEGQPRETFDTPKP